MSFQRIGNFLPASARAVTKPANGKKYKNKPTEVDGIVFDSAKEAARWQALRNLERAGVIRDLRRQVSIQLEGQRGPIRFVPSNRKAFYVADFAYFDVFKKVEVIEDTKGYQTDVFRLKRAILAAQGIEVILT